MGSIVADYYRDEVARFEKRVLEQAAEVGRQQARVSERDLAIGRLQGVIDAGRWAGSDPELIARKFHEAYERLAPDFSYKTREASAVPWDDVPDNNKKLMIAVCAELFGGIPDEETDTDDSDTDDTDGL